MRVDALALKHAEEALTGGVVPAVPDSTHRAQQRVLLQESLVVATPELTAAIRVQDHYASSLSLPDRHFDCPNHHPPIRAVMHRPADDELAEEVQHNTEKQLALAGPSGRGE